MAYTDAEARDAQDERFAVRLKKRDKSVVAEIDAAYTPALFKLLQPLEGPMLRREDMTEIAQDVLLKVWREFSTKAGKKKLRSFFFDQARWKAKDLLRKRGRQNKNRDKLLVVAGQEYPADNETPPDVFEREEASQIEEMILNAVEELKRDLTDRQRTAFEGRFGRRDSTSWASQLEKKTGKSASYWRKASDDALQVVKRGLEDRGLLRKKGGRYEVA